MTMQLIKLFQNPDFDTFREKLRNMLDCCSLRAVILFRNSGLEQLEKQTTWSDLSKGRTPIFLRDRVEVLRQQISFSDNNEDFIYRTVDKNRSDGTLFQCLPVNTTNFRDIYKSKQHRIIS